MNNNKIQLGNLIDFDSDAIITIGTRISNDNSNVQSYINKSLKDKQTEFIYMHPIDDITLQNKYTQYIKYEVGSEDGVFALLASFVISKAPQECKDYLDDLDIGYISAETSVGEEELELVVERLATKDKILLIIGNDITQHKNFENISKLIRVIDLYSDINIILLDEGIKLDLATKIIPEDIDDINTYNGTVVYSVDSTDNILRGSASFAMAAKIKDGDMVNIEYDNFSTKKKFEIDSDVRGTIALYPIYKKEDEKTMLNGYRFKQVKVKKVES